MYTLYFIVKSDLVQVVSTSLEYLEAAANCMELSYYSIEKG